MDGIVFENMERMIMTKLSPDQEVIAAHMAAINAAIQTLVNCLQDNEALQLGQYPSALRAYMQLAKDRADPMTLGLLDDLRKSFLS